MPRILALFLAVLAASSPAARAQATSAGAHRPAARAPAPPAFTFTVSGTSFTYSDAQRTFTGVFVVPAGPGPFPAAIVSHGQGGSATSYGLPKATQFQGLGLVSIAPNYTHAAGGSTLPAETGNCPENVARGLACLAVLRSLPNVDDARIVLWGHSKGAYATIGIAAAAPLDFAAAAISAGGIVPDSAGTGSAAPTVGEAASVSAPFLMFHGDGDTVVAPAQSALLEQQLLLHGVPELRVLYATSQHNLHQVPAIDADMLARFELWLQAHGVLP